MAAVGSLKCVAIAGRTDSAGAAQPDIDQEEVRMVLAMSGLTPGFTRNLLDDTTNANAFRVRQNTGTDMNVKVGSTTTKVDGYVLRGTASGQGRYAVRLDSTGLVVSVPATDPTNPARYGVYLFIDDVAYSGDASRAYAGISCIRGTPAVSPATPTALATWSASVLLWEFQLPANATAVTNAILDSVGSPIDQRVPAGVLLGAQGIVSGGYASIVASQTGFGAAQADITNLTVTFRPLIARRYRTTAFVHVQQQVGAGFALLTLADGSNTTLTVSNFSALTTAGYIALTYYETFVATTAVTRKLRISTNANTIDAIASATRVSYLVTEDVGPT